MLFDLGQMKSEFVGESLEPVIAAEPCEAGKLGALERQALGLLVGDHLQPVLDGAQEEIGLGQVLHRLRRHPVLGMEFAEHVERARAAHLWPSAAEDELLRLDEELDLANAAAPELDVVPWNNHALVPAHRVDLPLHRMDVGDRRVVEILSPDEGREIGEEAPSERKVAGRRTRLDQRRALPVLSDRLVIGVGASRREGDRRRSGIGPEPQIDPEHIAVGSALLEEPGERLGDSHQQGRRLDAFGNGGCGRVVEHDDVDIARIVELARAKLAEREHDQAAAGLKVRRVRVEREPAAQRVLAQEERERGADRGVGETGQGLGGFDHVPDAADIGERDQERRLALGEAERAHQRRFVVLGPRGQARDQRFERLMRRSGEQAREPGRILRRQRPEIGRMIGEAEEQIARAAETDERRERRRLWSDDQRLEPAAGGGGGGEPRRAGEPFSQRSVH